jgi:hypothetical protein
MALREIEIMAKMEYFHDLQREAERERLLRQGQATQSSNPFYRMLSRLGRNLVMIGNTLQERYCDCNLSARIEDTQR